MPARKLTHSEKSLLRSFYFDEVDYDKVRLTNRHIFSYLLRKFSAVTFGNTIVFSKKSFRNDFSETQTSSALLIHEICHVWQYQNLNYWWFKAMLEHLKFGKKVYHYNISDFEKLSNFRFEQQGEIMADYYRHIKAGNAAKSANYHQIIYNSYRTEKTVIK